MTLTRLHNCSVCGTFSAYATECSDECRLKRPCRHCGGLVGVSTYDLCLDCRQSGYGKRCLRCKAPVVDSNYSTCRKCRSVKRSQAKNAPTKNAPTKISKHRTVRLLQRKRKPRRLRRVKRDPVLCFRCQRHTPDVGRYCRECYGQIVGPKAEPQDGIRLSKKWSSEYR